MHTSATQPAPPPTPLQNAQPTSRGVRVVQQPLVARVLLRRAAVQQLLDNGPLICCRRAPGPRVKMEVGRGAVRGSVCQQNTKRGRGWGVGGWSRRGARGLWGFPRAPPPQPPPPPAAPRARASDERVAARLPRRRVARRALARVRQPVGLRHARDRARRLVRHPPLPPRAPALLLRARPRRPRPPVRRVRCARQSAQATHSSTPPSPADVVPRRRPGRRPPPRARPRTRSRRGRAGEDECRRVAGHRVGVFFAQVVSEPGVHVAACCRGGGGGG